MPYKLNNTVTITYNDGVVETIPCSYISWDGIEIFARSERDTKLHIHGREGGTAVSISTDSYKRMEYTDLPTEKEPEEAKESL